MNCYNHTTEPAVAQCLDCGKGLCGACASLYRIPLCTSCNKSRIASEKVSILKELLLTFGLGILLGVLFVKEIDGGHSYPLIHYIFSYTFFIYIFSGIVPGWRTLTRITPAIFLFLPLIGWLIYFVIKLALSLCVGIIMLPIRTIRNIYRLLVLRNV